MGFKQETMEESAVEYMKHPKFINQPEDPLENYDMWARVFKAFGFQWPPRGKEQYAIEMELLRKERNK